MLGSCRKHGTGTRNTNRRTVGCRAAPTADSAHKVAMTLHTPGNKRVRYGKRSPIGAVRCARDGAHYLGDLQGGSVRWRVTPECVGQVRYCRRAYLHEALFHPGVAPSWFNIRVGFVDDEGV